MGRTGLGVGLAVAALLVGGCGGAASGGGDRPAAGATTSATSPPQAYGAGGNSGGQVSYGPQFPLTLRRTGGSAGFDDRVVLDATGRVRVETRSVHGRVCRLDAPLQRQLLSLLETLRLGAGPVGGTIAPGDQPTPDGETTATDPITISVTDDRARAVDLSDPSLGEIAGLVAALVSDVTLSVPATTRCSSPTPSPSTTTR